MRTIHKQNDNAMCSYLPVFNSFNFTKGGLIQLNRGGPQPLQYVVNAAFLASLHADYLDTADTPGWYCGPNFYITQVLREFAMSQLDYILGKNPLKMSYVVGFGNKYPKRVHHRGASIPHDGVKYGFEGGFKWRDSKKANPNILTGAMVAGPDRHDTLIIVRTNYNYAEPTLAANAGLVAALISPATSTLPKVMELIRKHHLLSNSRNVPNPSTTTISMETLKSQISQHFLGVNGINGCLVHSKSHKQKAENISFQSFHVSISMTDQYKIICQP